jgi:hypothetical protein
VNFFLNLKPDLDINISKHFWRGLKGMGPASRIFCKVYKIESVLYVHSSLVFKCLGCLVEDKRNIKIFLASLKTLTNFKKNCSESRIIISALASLSFIGRFSPVTSDRPPLDAGKIQVQIQ